MKTIIAGSRDFNNQNILTKYLDKLIESFKVTISEVVSGTANGADKLGESYAISRGINIKKFPADWSNLDSEVCSISTNKYGNSYNKLAGFIRNKKMAEYSEQLIAFNVCNSSGTNNMIKLAIENGLKVIIFNFDKYLTLTSVCGV